MVTMPSEAADDYTLVSQLVQAGMDCMRVNCAHDSANAWARMIDNLHRAADQHRVQHVRQVEVGDELPLAGQQAAVLPARDRLPDEAGLLHVGHY